MTDRISLIWIRRLASFGMWACVVATFIPLALVFVVEPPYIPSQTLAADQFAWMLPRFLVPAALFFAGAFGFKFLNEWLTVRERRANDKAA